MTPRPARNPARAASTSRAGTTARTEASRAATSRTGTGRAEAGRTGTGRSATSRTGTGRTEAGRTGTGRSTTSRTESRRATGTRAGAGRTRATVGNTALAPRPTSPAPAGAARRRPALSVVPPVDTPPPRTPFVLLIVVLVGAGLVGLLLLNTAINENAFRLHDLDQRQEALNLREQQLERDIQRLEAPGTLQAAARRLGLVPAGNPAYIHLPSGQIVGVPTPAKAPAPTPSKTPAPTAGQRNTPSPGTPTTGATTPGAGQQRPSESAGQPTPTPGAAR